MMERDATRDRFIAAIADRVDPGSIEEAHFFQPIKQGQTESGVAVVAVRERKPPAENAANGPDALGAPAGDGTAENGPDAFGAPAENAVDRLAVYTARYRLTLRGTERGKFDFAIHAEADAPLGTVDKVVQGVQRRSGDVDDPEKLSGDEFRAILPAPPPPPAQSEAPTS